MWSQSGPVLSPPLNPQYKENPSLQSFSVLRPISPTSQNSVPWPQVDVAGKMWILSSLQMLLLSRWRKRRRRIEQYRVWLSSFALHHLLDSKNRFRLDRIHIFPARSTFAIDHNYAHDPIKYLKDKKYGQTVWGLKKIYQSSFVQSISMSRLCPEFGLVICENLGALVQWLVGQSMDIQSNDCPISVQCLSK